VAASGRYAVQGEQVRAGLELWAHRTGADLVLEDDRSDPDRSARLHARLSRRCDLVLGPYGGDCARAVARAAAGAVWNHGAAADDVQAMPNVVSVSSPASRYLATLACAVATLRPRAALALALGPGRFARFAREGLERAAPRLGLSLAARFSLGDPPHRIAQAGAGAVLACGPLERETAFLSELRALVPEALLGGVAPGVTAFGELLGVDPEGMLAPVQWHPDQRLAVKLGPTGATVLADAHAAGLGELDYVAAQAYASALVAARCLELAPEDPLAAARRLQTTTFFGAFGLDPLTGRQREHQMAVIRWQAGRRDLIHTASSVNLHPES